ncbi:MAG: hypothetical protein JNJ56_05100 [Ignavibacteria bacterium]|nr:hypothetical protein [Ignavibacteria bacterium]
MKKIIPPVITVIYFIMITGCSSVTPEKYFDIAVLNTNLLSGFAGNGMYRQLESPSVKLGDNNETVPMKRSEIINSKIKFLEENYEKLKGLKETEDTKEMIQASAALYEYVLPVYKKDYSNLAGLFDNGAPDEQVRKESQVINDKYFSTYDELYKKLISIGKVYAERHSIKVNWN